MLITGLRGNANCTFKDFSIVFTLIIEDPSLLYDTSFSLYFIFQIKCLIISERKQSQWWAREKRQSLEDNFLEVKNIPLTFVFNKHLLQVCSVTYLRVKNLDRTLFLTCARVI